MDYLFILMKIICFLFLCFIPVILFGQVKDSTFWNHVHHQSRLKVSSYDSLVTGKVIKISREFDGDYHLIIQSDSSHIIVGEIICACRGIMIACKGYKNKIIIPKVDDYVKIVGDSVIDKIHDDLPEIHPIKMLMILNK